GVLLNSRVQRRRNFGHLRSHVVDKEAENAGLGGYVQKLSNDRHHEVWVRPNGGRTPRRRIVHMKVVLGFDVGNIGKIEYDGKDDDHDRDTGVRNPERLAPGARSRGIFGIEKHAAGDWAENQADAVAGLGEIDASGAIFLGP